MKKIIKRIIYVMIAVVFVISLCGVAGHLINYCRADESYDRAMEIANTTTNAVETQDVEDTLLPLEPLTIDTSNIEKVFLDTEVCVTEPVNVEPFIETDEYAIEMLDMDIEALRKINPDVFGWISIPDTSISYPLLQGRDNSYYLDYSWEGMKNRVGSIYLDYRSSQKLDDFNTIIYGHRMYIDAMFNALKNYSDPEFLENHPSVYVLTDGKVFKYNVFSAYNADVKGPSWRLGLTGDAGQQAYINYCIDNSVVDSGIVPSAADEDRILTLSTCTQSGDSRFRWVVHCVFAGEYSSSDITEE